MENLEICSMAPLLNQLTTWGLLFQTDGDMTDPDGTAASAFERARTKNA